MLLDLLTVPKNVDYYVLYHAAVSTRHVAIKINYQITTVLVLSTSKTIRRKVYLKTINHLRRALGAYVQGSVRNVQ